MNHSVSRLANLLDFGQLFKALGHNYFLKSPTFLGNFCKGVKIFNCPSEIIFGQLLETFRDFYLVTLNLPMRRITRETLKSTCLIVMKMSYKSIWLQETFCTPCSEHELTYFHHTTDLGTNRISFQKLLCRLETSLNYQLSPQCRLLAVWPEKIAKCCPKMVSLEKWMILTLLQ